MDDSMGLGESRLDGGVGELLETEGEADEPERLSPL